MAQRAENERSQIAARSNGSHVVTGTVQMPTDPAALERAIEERRAQLASTIDELMYRTRPKEIARRTGAKAQLAAVSAVTDEAGDPDPKKIGAIASAVVAVVVLVVWRRRALAKKKASPAAVLRRRRR